MTDPQNGDEQKFNEALKRMLQKPPAPRQSPEKGDDKRRDLNRNDGDGQGDKDGKD